jgi:hypothetical protein
MSDKLKEEKAIFEMKVKAVKAALADFIKTPGGKNWIRNIADSSMIMSEQVFTGNSHTFYNLGMRSIGLSILRDAKDADPDAYAEIIKELDL